jgi:tetratricopeptide (TPR) repeat protein/O-antigen ligase
MRCLDSMSAASLYALLLWVPLGLGGNRPVPLAITQLLTLAGLVAWVLRMILARRLEWRRTSLDLPLALLIALVLVQLAIGNRPLAEWALAPPPPDARLPVEFPRGPFILGTVSTADTGRSLLLFLTYAAVYVLVVNLRRTRRQLDRLVRTLLVLGGLVAFLGLLDYLTAEAWLLRWRDHPFSRRVSGTFINPDHFAAWLGMLVCLGIGYLLARSPAFRADHRLRDLWGSRDGREELVRRYLPVVAVGVMALSLVFTLSRGGIVSLLVALAALLVLQGTRGRARRSLVLVGCLLAVTFGYAAWIGLGPLLARLEHGGYAGRLVQSLTTLPMVGSFPLLGVGLGAYRHIYFRYQPPELSPGTVYFEFAHNDLLELAVETGLVGAAIFLFAVWRVGTDLLGAHLLGGGRCPVRAGEDEAARRRESFSLGLGLGALAGVLTLLVHSAFDFAARIPANGVLAATCLGIATVALHTRFGAGDERLLVAVRARSLGTGRLRPAVAATSAVAVALVFAFLVARPPLIQTALRGTGPATLRRTDQALAFAPRDVEALRSRAQLRVAAARRVWDSGQTSDGRTLATWEERRREALVLLSGAIEDLRAALSVTPTAPYLHEQLGWAHGAVAMIDPERRASAMPAALASLHRAIALQPANPYLYGSLAVLASTQGAQFLPLALDAARGAIQRDPGLLRELANHLLPLGPSDAQWAALVPDSGLDRLELGAFLEELALVREATQEYRRAAQLLPRGESSFARWKLARLLMQQGDYAAAVAEIDAALERDPDNPELQLARATALAERHEPAALDAFRAAARTGEAWIIGRVADQGPFEVGAARARALVVQALGQDAREGALRYRRALAQYLSDEKLWDQALREWDQVLAQAPQHATACFGRGVALAGLGRRDEALEAYRKAVSLEGRSVAFRLRLAQTLWETDQYYQAMTEWGTVIAQEPGNVEARLALAAGYARIGQRTEALREYARILQLVPGQPEARKGLSRLGGIPGG